MGDASSQTVESLRQADFAIDELSQVAVGLRSGVSRFKVTLSNHRQTQRCPSGKQALFLLFRIGSERYARSRGGGSAAASAVKTTIAGAAMGRRVLLSRCSGCR